MTNKNTNPELKLEDTAEDMKKVKLDLDSTLTAEELNIAIDFVQGKGGVKPEDQQRLEEILSTKVNVWETMQLAKVFSGIILNQDLNLIEGLMDNFSIQRKVLLDTGVMTEDDLKKATEDYFDAKKKAVEAQKKAEEANKKAKEATTKSKAKK